jgi:UDP-N-acetylmuramoyl-tripeptide--D-alanyl-D-alanine ligase
MGMSAPREISAMTRAATPDIAMVINVGSSHLEYLGTRENIAKAKLEIGEGIIEGGYLLLNGDEILLADHYSERYETLYVGFETLADRDVHCGTKIMNVKVESDGTRFTLRLLDTMLFDLKIALVGKHFAYNAAFAATAAYLLGASEDEIREGLASYIPTGLRMNVYEKGGVTIVADCYNAAPESMKGAIDTLSQLNVSGKRVAVLGDMKELGSSSDELHASVGKYLADKGIDRLFTVGSSGALIAKAALGAGMSEKNVTAFDEELGASAIAEMIKENIAAGDAILFKASRAMKLEELIKAIFND